ncbi:MAG: ATP-dependent DNA helicase [Clostridia bacterium]|nr:ATP-dependent DNA helicase [Clostridia bacterium]
MEYDAGTKTLRLSAAQLCKKAANHGDINARGFRIFEGGRMSERLAEKYGADYQTDLSLSGTICRGGFFFEIFTKCDGYLHRKEGDVLFVHRAVSTATARLTADHTAEYVGLCVLSAHLAVLRSGAESLTYCLTLSHGAKDVRTVEKTMTREELAAAAARLVDRFLPFASLAAEAAEVRVPGCRALSFPYAEMRVQQREFMHETLRAVKAHGALLVEAPTGTGKTMAALYPAFKALGAGHVEKIFYFTSKNTTALAALDAAKRLSASAKIRAIHITAKERLCPTRSGDPYKCTPRVCPRAGGHYKRLADAICDIMTAHRVISDKEILETAGKYKVCPYEFALDLTDDCDLIVCDCNYLIDEAVYFRRYFSGGGAGKYLFLFDEAHNLPDRAKDAYSASLALSTLKNFRAETEEGDHPVLEALDALILYVEGMRALCEDSVQIDAQGRACGFCALAAFDKTLSELLTAFLHACDRYFYSAGYGALPPSLHGVYAAAKEFSTALSIFDTHFVGTVEVKNGELILQALCLDPSGQLQLKLKKGVASVFFSATLSPLEYYATLFGAPHAAKLKLDSPYDRSNLAVCILDKISVRYQVRSQNAAAVAEAIFAAAKAKRGNYMVYFPSYAYLKEVYAIFSTAYPRIRTVVQSREMKSGERRAFLDAFSAENAETLVGFSVLGGIYAEGIDLVGERLIGSVIVGVGMILPTNESELLAAYCEEKYEAGKEYAYIYPGFNKVLQAAGRVIRTERDRGVIVLIDERYVAEPYRSLLPRQYRHAKLCGSARALSAVLKAFWARGDDTTERTETLCKHETEN